MTEIDYPKQLLLNDWTFLLIQAKFGKALKLIGSNL